MKQTQTMETLNIHATVYTTHLTVSKLCIGGWGDVLRRGAWDLGGRGGESAEKTAHN